VLIAIGAIVLDLIGRSEDVITASITTTVVMVVAAISPQQAWRQPILRLIDTIVGIGVGIAGAWIGLKLATRIPNQALSRVGQIHEEHSLMKMDNLLTPRPLMGLTLAFHIIFAGIVGPAVLQREKL